MFAPVAEPRVRSFLARAVRLDPAALVRMRPAGDGNVQLWTVLPFKVLAGTTVPAQLSTDVTVAAADLAAGLSDGTMPATRDGQWRGAVPGDAGTVLEQLSAAECRGIGAAAADTLRRSRGRGLGDRRLRDALLDHVTLRVCVEQGEYELRLRLVLGLLRMGLVGDDTVRVRLTAGRLGLETDLGVVWNPAPGLSVLTVH